MFTHVSLVTVRMQSANTACRQLMRGREKELGNTHDYSCYSVIILCIGTHFLYSSYIHAHIADSIARSNAYFGQGSGSILMNNVGCTGSESRLIDCSYSSSTSSCSHSEDAGVQCYSRKLIRQLINECKVRAIPHAWKVAPTELCALLVGLSVEKGEWKCV